MLQLDKIPPAFLLGPQASRRSLLVNKELLGMQGLTRTLLYWCWASWGEPLFLFAFTRQIDPTTANVKRAWPEALFYGSSSSS